MKQIYSLTMKNDATKKKNMNIRRKMLIREGEDKHEKKIK